MKRGHSPKQVPLDYTASRQPRTGSLSHKVRPPEVPDLWQTPIGYIQVKPTREGRLQLERHVPEQGEE